MIDIECYKIIISQLSSYSSNEVVFKRKQFPVKLAYA